MREQLETIKKKSIGFHEIRMIYFWYVLDKLYFKIKRIRFLTVKRTENCVVFDGFCKVSF